MQPLLKPVQQYKSVSDIPRDAHRGRIGFLLTLVAIAVGSILILFPAWLPNNEFNAIGEDGMVEMLQLILLIISAALFFSAAPHAGRLKPIFFALGLGGIAGAIGEYASPLEAVVGFPSEWIVWPLLLVIGFIFLLNGKPFVRFWGYASRRPAAGFLLAGVIIAYVFGNVFGSSEFWEASLGPGYNTKVPEIVEAYLELLACYFIFVSSLGFCIPVTKREKINSLG